MSNRITYEKAAGHLKTVCTHKYEVMKNCFAVGLYRQGIMHDMSKFMPTELLNGFRYYQGTESPNNGERRKKGYSEAWMHHKGRNRHHYEYWNDYNINRGPGEEPIIFVKMPRRYVVEMVMDRIAASKTYLKDKYTEDQPLEYFEHGRAKALMHPQTAMELERMLKILKYRGQDELFRFIREYYLKGYPMK